MSRNSKGFVQVFVIILLLILVGGVAYYFGMQKGNLPLDVSSTLAPTKSTESLQTNASPESTVDPTANWKIYTNSTNGYSIKFPDSFLRLICTGEELTATKRGKDDRPGPIEIGDCARGGRYTLETKTYDSIQKEPEETKYYVIERKNITLGGLPAKQYTYTFTNIEVGPFPTWYTIAWVNKNNRTYEIYFDQKDMLSTFNQILSTFKFTN